MFLMIEVVGVAVVFGGLIGGHVLCLTKNLPWTRFSEVTKMSVLNGQVNSIHFSAESESILVRELRREENSW
jgi:hypothetical protein